MNISQRRKKSSVAKHKITLTPDRVLLGKYRYLRILGSGGMGEVHLVIDIESEQKLAMKCCLETRHGKRFEREVHSWMRLGKHPNLVAAIYFDWIDDVPCLFIEYVDGTDLREIINASIIKKQDAPLETVLDYAIQICCGMAHLHKHGVIHRDLKPSNILISREESGIGTVKITDMGLSKMKGFSEMNDQSTEVQIETLPPELTRTQDMLGTPQYMSPQQYANSKGVGETTDIYAFGLIVYELLSQGKRPFEVDNYQGWLYAHTHAKPKHIKKQVTGRFHLFRRKAHNELYELVMQCLAKKISERPQSFRDLQTQLEDIYQRLCTKKYRSTRSYQSNDTSPQQLNNQAISLLEMGASYNEEGVKKLEKLCSVSDCLEAHLNFLLAQLKNGQSTLGQFWQDARRLPPGPAKDKVAQVMLGTALERGSYRQQSLRLLENFSEVSPAIARFQAKWLYLSGSYCQALAAFKALATSSYCLWEDFYHWAGSLIQDALQREQASLIWQKNKFVLNLNRESKQMVWYILKQGEEKCGPFSWLEKAKDIAIGTAQARMDFWYEKGILTGHRGKVHSVAVAADHLRAISGGEDRTVRLWDLGQQQELACLSGHQEMITSVDIEPEGNYAISGCGGGGICFWDLRRARLLDGLQAHRGKVNAVMLSTDAAKGVSAGDDGSIAIWNAALVCRPGKWWNLLRRKRQHTFHPNRGAIHSVGYHPGWNQGGGGLPGRLGIAMGFGRKKATHSVGRTRRCRDQSSDNRQWQNRGFGQLQLS